MGDSAFFYAFFLIFKRKDSDTITLVNRFTQVRERQKLTPKEEGNLGGQSGLVPNFESLIERLKSPILESDRAQIPHIYYEHLLRIAETKEGYDKEAFEWMHNLLTSDKFWTSDASADTRNDLVVALSNYANSDDDAGYP